jgi:SUF system NifU family Fe-S assembly protein
MNNGNNAPEPMLDDLYRELILDHYRHPRNRGHLERKTTGAEGYNPVCGDEIAVDVELEGGRITNVGFVGRGCSISQASGSMMTDAVKGLTRRRRPAFEISAPMRPAAAGGVRRPGGLPRASPSSQCA